MSKTHRHQPKYYDISKLSEQGRFDREQLLASLSKYEKITPTLVGLDLAEAEDRMFAILTSLEWQGADPKRVSFDKYVELVRSRKPDRSKTENDAAKRIKNRSTAIRAFCIGCMCGDTALVRSCTSLTCPMHPFRLGNDPFRGYEPPPPTIDVVLEDDDEVIMFEDEDD